MTKLGITFIILIIVGVLVEAALLFKIVAIPPDISQLISGQSKPNAVSLEKIAPA